MFRKLIFLIPLLSLGLVLQACGIKPKPEESCNFVQNGDLQRVSWGAQTPVIMYIDSKVPGEFFESIQRAADNWNKAVGREVIKIGGWTDRVPVPRQDQVNVIYYLQDWESNKENEQARTTIYWGGDRIYEADIRINNHNFEFFGGSEPIVGRVDMESLILHEMGHVLGLGHTNLKNSVMVKSLPHATEAVPGSAFRRKLSGDDTSSVQCEY